ncbi:hypothetical protein BX600DRAFT_439582 [Xylariales sp. PMI_506]|nr:hypothetical protein BX600DRAFT_439582 [Xylariales sp. PMI_506]
MSTWHRLTQLDPLLLLTSVTVLPDKPLHPGVGPTLTALATLHAEGLVDTALRDPAARQRDFGTRTMPHNRPRPMLPRMMLLSRTSQVPLLDYVHVRRECVDLVHLHSQDTILHRAHAVGARHGLDVLEAEFNIFIILAGFPLGAVFAIPLLSWGRQQLPEKSKQFMQPFEPTVVSMPPGIGQRDIALAACSRSTMPLMPTTLTQVFF